MNGLKLFLKLFLAVLFLVSGFAKLFPIEPFELLIVNQSFIGWGFVPFISRLIIAFELFLGLALLTNIYYRKIFLPVSFLLLLAFNIQLIASMAMQTAGDNCGCFGEVLPMSPLEALLKNIVLMVVIAFLYIKNERQDDKSIKPLILLSVLSVSLVFIIAPYKPYVTVKNTEEPIVKIEEKKVIVSDTIKRITGKKEEVKKKDTVAIVPEEKQEEIKYNSIFGRFKSFSGNINVNLDEGLKLVALFSLDCEHCLETAMKIGELSKTTKVPPLYILFFGEEDYVKTFFREAKAEFPYKILTPQDFFPMITSAPPRVCLLKNGKILADWNSGHDIPVELVRFLGRE